MVGLRWVGGGWEGEDVWGVGVGGGGGEREDEGGGGVGGDRE